MTHLKRTAEATWTGDLKGGKGLTSGTSEAFENLAYSFATRFENAPGTNPEELIASAHAACFSMALSKVIADKGFTPGKVETNATVTLTKGDAGFKVTGVHLDTKGTVEGMDEETFQEAAEAAKENCPISVLLKPGLETLTVEARLA